MVDAVIVGGGPAGASCALWLKMLGFKPCIIERRDSLGGLQNARFVATAKRAGGLLKQIASA